LNPVDAILALLRNVLWGTEILSGISGLDADAWNHVLGIAAAQGILVLLRDSVDSLPDGVRLSDDLLSRWDAQVSRNEARHALVRKVAEAQEGGWRKKGINYAMLKGLALAVMYSHPEHRACGDIDWYFPTDADWNQARLLAEKVTGGPVKYDSDGDVSYVWNNVVIEHHHGWSHLSSRKAAKLLSAPAIVDGKLAPEDELLMLNGHILHHIMVTGCGLRQFADLAVAYAHHDGKYDKTRYAERLDSLGLTKWTALLHSALVILTGIDENYLPVTPGGRKSDVDRMVRLVFADGNLGLAKKRRFSGVLSRAFLFMRYCPGEFVARYSGLLRGRLKNRVK